MKKRAILFCSMLLLTSFAVYAAPEAETKTAGPTIESLAKQVEELSKSKSDEAHVDWLWTILAACLVFFMQAGFGMVEAGFTRAKNAVNIMMKNFADMSFGVLAFWFVGFGLMFGANEGGYFGTEGFMVDPKTIGGGHDANWIYSFFMFQSVFAATAVTIVSGAIAERTKFSAYILFAIVMCAFIYPISGSWAWGGLLNGSGFLENFKTMIGGKEVDTIFNDFAGSTVVHAVGGFAALAAAIVVGPRKGKFVDGKVGVLPGHSMPLVAIGVFILWLGWFGFNAGSTTSLSGGDFGKIAMVTLISACAGFIGAILFSLIQTGFKKWDAGFGFNGVLAGLVSITAGCANTTPGDAMVLGFVGGLLVCASVLFFDKIGVDDAVGAISVHGICGIWGTLGLALFDEGTIFYNQLIGVIVMCGYAFVATFIVFTILKFTIGVRVSAQEELQGLDVTEHGYEAYPKFQS